MSDLELFKYAIALSRLTPHTTPMRGQLGFYKGYLIGAVMVRDSIDLSTATERASSIRKNYFEKWKEGVLEPSTA